MIFTGEGGRVIHAIEVSSWTFFNRNHVPYNNISISTKNFFPGISAIRPQLETYYNIAV